MIASLSLVHEFRRLAVLLLIMTAFGCGSTSQTRYLHANADLGAIRKVAILPFDTVTADKTDADKVQKIFYLEVLALEVFEVAEPGDVARITRGLQVESLGTSDYQRMGQQLGVDAFFTGSVVDFDQTHSGGASSPEVTIQLRLIEAGTGATIWSTGQSRSGVAVSTRLFGFGGESLTEAARRMLRAELGTLLK